MTKPTPGRFGFSDKDTLPFLEAREKVYDEFFGLKPTVSHELVPLVPHVDLYVFEPGYDGRDFYTIVTGGMSDLPMHTPKGMDYRRAELILYAAEPKEHYVGLLRWLAHLAHDQNTWLSPGSTMTNGQPPQPIFEGSQLDCFLFLSSIVSPDNTLPEKLVLENDPVDFLWVVPISSAECDFVRRQGLNDFLDILDHMGHSHLVDEKRRSFVGSDGAIT